MTRWLLLIYLLLPFFTRAQQNSQYFFRHIDQQDGLLHNIVSTMAQDQKGFMWIASANGIQRFDGFRFTSYESKLKAFSYLPGIKNLFPDTNNTIWIISSQLARINTVTGAATVYDEQKILSDPRFKFEAYTDHLRRRWLLCPFALFVEDSITRKMKLYSTCLPNEKSELGNTIFPDSFRHCTWVTDHDNFMLFDQKTRAVYTAEYNPLQNPILKAFAKKSISFLLLDKQHNIWAAEWGSVINKYDEQLRTIKEYYPIQSNSRNNKGRDFTVTTLCIFQDSHGAIWMGNDHSELFRYAQTNDRFETISEKSGEQKGLQYNYVFLCISEDHDGNLWLGTDKGINIFNPYHQYFYAIAHQENNPSSLPENEITSFIQTKNGSVYIGTWGGGFSIYDSSLKFQRTISPKGVFELPLIWCFAENDDGKIWIGAQHGFLHIYDPLTNKLETIRPPEMENKTIRCMKKDGEGNLWFGLHSGKLVKWEKKSRRFLIPAETGVKNQWSVKNIFVDSKGQFWISTDNGLFQFDPQSLQYLGFYRPSASFFPNAASDEIHGIEQWNDSILVIGTMRSGAYLFNCHSKRFIQHPAFSGLPASNVFAVKKDAENNLWMSSDYHLYELRRNDGKLLRHDLPPGLINSAFEMLSFYPLQNGNWLTASKTDAVIFNPTAMNYRTALKKTVAITGFKIFDKEINIDSLIYKNEPLKLKYDQNFITLEFTTHSYLGITESIYYKLTGVDKSWVKANEKAVASYTNLAPGLYVFRVKSGIENADAIVTSFIINIAPPVYLTWWFKTIVFMLVSFTIYFLAKRRIQSIRHKAELRHKISEAEMMALRSQMNPHFIFNCLSAIDNLIQTNQADKATTYLARFAKLIRSVLESTKSNLVPFYKDFESLKLYVELEQFSSGNKFSYQLHADEELLNGDYKVPPLIAQPFAENAIHHGLLNKLNGSRTLHIRVSLQNPFICYTITDNGVGRKKAMEIKHANKPEQVSYGIEITEERIELHNQSHKMTGENGLHDGINYINFKDLTEGDGPSGTEVRVLIKHDN